MNWDWATIKEKLQHAYGKFAQLLLFQLACFYLLACVVAQAPVGPRGYVSFIYHCFQWRPRHRVEQTRLTTKHKPSILAAPDPQQEPEKAEEGGQDEQLAGKVAQ